MTTNRIQGTEIAVPSSWDEDTTTETYGVYYPYDGLFVDWGSEESARENAEASRNTYAVHHVEMCRGAVAIKITVEVLGT